MWLWETEQESSRLTRHEYSLSIPKTEMSCSKTAQTETTSALDAPNFIAVPDNHPVETNYQSQTHSASDCQPQEQ